MKPHAGKLSLFLFLSGAIGLFLYSCSKSARGSGSGTSHLEVRLTDAPAIYDAVYIDVQQVEVNASDSNAADSGEGSGWQIVPLLRAGVYNLLDFRNGIDTILAAANLPAGKLSQIRLVLGDSNFVVIGGQSYPMETPSAQESGLKLNINAVLTAGIDYKLWIDFDASRSIVQTGNGKFILKPVLRAYSEAAGGSIKGFVLPGLAMAEIWAIQGTDTLMALADTTTGYYFFGGVSAGSWNLLFQPRDTSFADTSAQVNVSTGVVTNADTINLRPK